ncbi:MAG: ABC transporter substrate-binding protein [Cytophagales bacterium]|nr:ABC transporter substrate-binding protein [Cytophagales bacterium]
MKRFALLFLLIAGPLAGFAQNNTDSAFIKAKQLMQNKQFALALDAFRPLTSPQTNSFPQAPYACYYYAYCAYQTGNLPLAKDMFLQIKSRFPRWNKKDDVNLWLAELYFKNRQPNEALSLAREIRNPQIKKQLESLLVVAFDSASVKNTLKALNKVPSRALAQLAADKLQALPLNQKKFKELDRLVKDFKLDNSRYHLPDSAEVFKKRYRVAVLLPFLYLQDSAAMHSRPKNLVYDLYEGMRAAQKALAEENIEIELLAYDTKRNADTTLIILEKDQLQQADLIVGPLYPEPTRLTEKFARQYQINWFSPLSNNGMLVQENRFAHLFMPSSENLAKNAAEFINKKNLENKQTFIFYGSKPMDSVNAYTYKKQVEDSGYQVVLTEKFTKETSRRINEILTETVEVPTDSLDEFGDPIMQDSLLLQPDSIGHIYIASEDNLIASNAITGIDSRPDTIVLVGSGKWLYNPSIGLKTLEKNAVYLAAPTYVDYESASFQAYASLYEQQTFQSPNNRFAIIGYDLLYMTGKLLHNKGRRFMSESEGEFIYEPLFQGYQADSTRSNAYVPIIEIENAKVRILNPKK